MNRKIALDVLGSYNFDRIVDIGSGQGALTHQLKRINNQVLGLDISSTAIDIARGWFPDIEFDVVNVNNVPWFADYLAKRFGGHFSGGVDLCFLCRMPALHEPLEGSGFCVSPSYPLSHK